MKFTLLNIMTILQSFGERIKNIRKNQNLSQEKLAELSGLHRTYISSIECGTRNPTLTTLNSLAKAFDLDISYLVSGINDE